MHSGEVNTLLMGLYSCSCRNLPLQITDVLAASTAECKARVQWPLPQPGPAVRTCSGSSRSAASGEGPPHLQRLLRTPLVQSLQSLPFFSQASPTLRLCLLERKDLSHRRPWRC